MGGLNRDSDLIVLIHQWLPAIQGFPKQVGDAHKDGHCPREAASAPGLERAESEERLRKCCVRIVTQNISETPVRMGRGGEGGIRCEKEGGGGWSVELRQVGQV